MLYSYEREEWEDSGDAWVQVYHHLVNNTYRIVGRNVKDESVCLQLINVYSFLVLLLIIPCTHNGFCYRECVSQVLISIRGSLKPQPKTRVKTVVRLHFML